MLNVNRAEFLQHLEMVQPGLSTRDIIEQSSCFIFKNKKVITYNDEVSCSRHTGIDLTGAVQSGPLLAILSKLDEDELELETGEGELIVKGKRRRAGIRMESDILLPLDNIDKPEVWKTLPNDFHEAIDIVQQCAGKDQSHFTLTCVHIHPKWVEACDNFQLSRYRIKTGIDKPTLVRQSAIRSIISLGMTEFSETDSWIHFRNASKLVVSCRHYVDEFPNISELLKVEGGNPISLPKGLVEAIDKAQIFSSENSEVDQVLVRLMPGKLRIKGQGSSGWYTETKSMRYEGPVMEFLISPILLSELIKRHTECFVTEDRLKVDGGAFVYVTVLGKIEEKEAKESGKESE